MVNARRGEVPLTIAGQTYHLCLTLGALAELEQAFAVEGLRGLGTRFAEGSFSSCDVMILLKIALRGGGHDLTDQDVAALPLDEGLTPYLSALTTLLTLTFGVAPNPP
jgi:hypothetical protein